MKQVLRLVVLLIVEIDVIVFHGLFLVVGYVDVGFEVGFDKRIFVLVAGVDEVSIEVLVVVVMRCYVVVVVLCGIFLVVVVLFRIRFFVVVVFLVDVFVVAEACFCNFLPCC